jgi:NADH dehydrogenase FAD-containing subunit
MLCRILKKIKFKMNFNLKFSYEKFDFIIIGSGQAGIPLAFSLSKRDSSTYRKVCWVELALIMVALLQSLCS